MQADDSIVTGVLKGFDQLLNLVLDDVVEQLQTGTLPSDFPLRDWLTAFRRRRADLTTTRAGRIAWADHHAAEPSGRLRRDREPLPCPGGLRSAEAFTALL